MVTTLGVRNCPAEVHGRRSICVAEVHGGLAFAWQRCTGGLVFEWQKDIIMAEWQNGRVVLSGARGAVYSLG